VNIAAVPLDLGKLVAPEHTVVVTQECQNGIIGEHAVLRDLADAAGPMLEAGGRLVAAAREAGVMVIHCRVVRRPDGKASSTNARMYKAAQKAGIVLTNGSVEAEVVPQLGPDERDIVLDRYHGLGPMGGTDLDMVCRNLGATTMIGVGVSVNVGMLSLALDAVNHGYQLVMPRDCVAGVPQAYADDVMANTIAMIGTVTTADDIIGAWQGS
jgi:biuret amidohydrolase